MNANTVIGQDHPDPAGAIDHIDEEEEENYDEEPDEDDDDADALSSSSSIPDDVIRRVLRDLTLRLTRDGRTLILTLCTLCTPLPQLSRGKQMQPRVTCSFFSTIQIATGG